MYCMSGSVFMPVRTPQIFSCVSHVSQRMILCTQCVSQKIFLCIRCASQGPCFPLMCTRHQNLGVPKFSPPEIFPAEIPPSPL